MLFYNNRQRCASEDGDYYVKQMTGQEWYIRWSKERIFGKTEHDSECGFQFVDIDKIKNHPTDEYNKK